MLFYVQLKWKVSVNAGDELKDWTGTGILLRHLETRFIRAKPANLQLSALIWYFLWRDFYRIIQKVYCTKTRKLEQIKRDLMRSKPSLHSKTLNAFPVTIIEWADVCGVLVSCEGMIVFRKKQRTLGQTVGWLSCGKAYCWWAQPVRKAVAGSGWKS